MSMGTAERSGTKRRAVISPVQPQTAQVRPGWLLGALGLLGLAALCCAYLSLCLLFVQGQWQLLYRPSRVVAATPASLGLPFSQVRFGTTEAGVSELAGWLVPAAPGSELAGTTVLYLHDASGSLGDTLPAIARLHGLGCTVFAIDYRGFGASAAEHPSEARMGEDAAQALSYLVGTLHVGPRALVVWGRGVGATIGAEAVETQAAPSAIRLVLEAVNPPALQVVNADPRTRWLPVRLLLRDRLDAASVLAASKAPKLFLGSGTDSQRLYALAAAPKQLASAGDDAELRTFLILSGRP